ncbi:MAG: diguanylate cyclase [Sulfurifustaceae bacterium]
MNSPDDLGRYLEAIVDLTRYRDSHDLALALLETLRRNISARDIRLLAIANDRRDAEFNEGNIDDATVYDLLAGEASNARALREDAALVACVKTQAPVIDDASGRRRAVFPVFGANDVWLLVVVDDWRDGLPRALLAKLLRVYGNQAYILSRSQLDPLTGLYNRQSFYERLTRLAQGAMPRRRAADGDGARPAGHCFALIDVDHFKDVNDRYGHLYGDEVLLLLARLMLRSFRHEDVLFRYGGEEFAVVLHHVDVDAAGRLLERFRRAVEAYAFPRLEPKTVSVGFTALTVESGPDKVVMCADRALYYAKNHGRNKVCCYEKLVAERKLDPVAVDEGDIELF